MSSPRAPGRMAGVRRLALAIVIAFVLLVVSLVVLRTVWRGGYQEVVADSVERGVALAPRDHLGPDLDPADNAGVALAAALADPSWRERDRELLKRLARSPDWSAEDVARFDEQSAVLGQVVDWIDEAAHRPASRLDTGLFDRPATLEQPFELVDLALWLRLRAVAEFRREHGQRTSQCEDAEQWLRRTGTVAHVAAGEAGFPLAFAAAASAREVLLAIQEMALQESCVDPARTARWLGVVQSLDEERTNAAEVVGFEAALVHDQLVVQRPFAGQIPFDLLGPHPLGISAHALRRRLADFDRARAEPWLSRSESVRPRAAAWQVGRRFAESLTPQLDGAVERLVVSAAELQLAKAALRELLESLDRTVSEPLNRDAEPNRRVAVAGEAESPYAGDPVVRRVADAAQRPMVELAFAESLRLWRERHACPPEPGAADCVQREPVFVWRLPAPAR